MSPVTYLWIALGGALGSVGRAWLAFALARLTGPQFPWGTILINVVGSFVIGFVGTLTASSAGRFAVPADLRAFIMIGICGGFTTFSSFSLQTLELARDGRPGQALANIGLSLALCLASVAAGHYGAASLNRGSVVQEDAMLARPAASGGLALALLDRPEAAPRLLSAAAQFLRLGHGGRVNALALTPEPAVALLPTEEVMTAERRAEDAARQQHPAARLRAAFDRWAGQAAAQGLGVEWTEVEGNPAAAVAEHGRGADLIVSRRPGRQGDALAREALHAALFEVGRPVLLVPPGAEHPSAREPVIAIAWRNDPHAARAVRSAVLLLRKTRRIVVLCGTERHGAPPPLPQVLQAHRARMELVRVVAQDGAPMGAALLAEARRRGAGLLVMGAFAHAPLRERLLGGVTRQILAEADLPVLMQHATAPDADEAPFRRPFA